MDRNNVQQWTVCPKTSRLQVPFPGWIIPKTIKMVPIASLRGTQYSGLELGCWWPNDSRRPLLPTGWWVKSVISIVTCQSQGLHDPCSAVWLSFCIADYREVAWCDSRSFLDTSLRQSSDRIWGNLSMIILCLFTPVQVFLPLRCTSPVNSQKRPVSDFRVLQDSRKLCQQSSQPRAGQVRNHCDHRGCERCRHWCQRLCYHLRRQWGLGPACTAAKVPQPFWAGPNRPFHSGDVGPRRAPEGQSGARQQRLQLRVVLGVRWGDQHGQLGDNNLPMREVAGCTQVGWTDHACALPQILRATGRVFHCGLFGLVFYNQVLVCFWIDFFMSLSLFYTCANCISCSDFFFIKWYYFFLQFIGHIAHVVSHN